ncbi:MAG: SPW repeat protein [Archangium sp.]
MWARWSNMLLSAWLVIAPLILGFDSPAARANTVTVGLCLFLFALVAEAIPAVRFVDTALGVWLVFSPFLLGYSHEAAPTANGILVGLLVAALSLVPSRGWLFLRPRRRVHA